MGMILLIVFLIPWGVIRGTGHHDCFVVFSGWVDCFLLACCMLTGEGRIDALFEFCRLEIAFVLGLLSFYDQKL